MDLVRLGARLRAIRIARGERLIDVAARSGLSKSTISRDELGESRRSPVGNLERHAAALGASLEATLWWPGGDIDRLINAAHSALHEAVARLFAAKPQWIAVPEVSFSIYGERGVIDWLAWHPATRSLLVIELKTALVDVQAVLATLDRYTRLASQIARARGWEPATVSVWLLFEDSARNRRAVAAHRQLFHRVLPSDGSQMRAWLRAPGGRIAALSFLSNSHRATPRRRIVRRRRTSAPVARSIRPEMLDTGGRGTGSGPPGGNPVEARTGGPPDHERA
jgi:transcriptional regulator with XRE-family HTH domain